MVLYVDDVSNDGHNSWCGELLAIREFNDRNKLRKIERPVFITRDRAVKHPPWLLHMFFCHVLDHTARQPGKRKTDVVTLDNPYL